MTGSTKAILTATAIAVLAIAGGSAYYYAHPKLQAQSALKHYVRACKSGDREAFCRYTVYEQIAPFYEIFDGADQSRPVEERIGTELSEILANVTEIRSVKVDSVKDCTDEFAERIQRMWKNHEAEQKIMARRDIEPDPVFEAGYERVLSYMESVKQAYCFDVTMQRKGEGDSAETAQIVVSRINGCWKVDPFTPIMVVPTVHDPDEQTT
ncbi:MAG: hypothetical protein IKI45_04390 [Oscillospiraceae bacterium]|nr:hypothetical protein [Oscillospiraceae bacterium]